MNGAQGRLIALNCGESHDGGGTSLLVGSVALVGIVAFAAISYHAFQAARIDPATTLKDE
jgi:hypothetical protein